MEELSDAANLHFSLMTMETDEDSSLILELSENDPLFGKKKVLLKNKGFGSKERVTFGSALSVDRMHTALEAILQIARIIHLDEAELYFEGNVNSQVDFYGPRNELESLGSIVSLIDVSLSNGEENRKNSLQDLREATLFWIREFGEKYRLDSRIIESCSCEKEKLLLQWGESNGVSSKLRIAYVEGAGRGALAAEDLKVGETALDVPISIIISEELVHESDMFHILKNVGGISSETMILLWSMKERHNCNSKFKIYFDTLPETFNTGLSFGIDAIMALDGTLLLEEIIQAKEHLRSQYDQLFPVLSEDYPDMFPQDLYTWEQFLWACELWYSNGMKVMFADGKARTCLIPVAGFLNHSLYPHIIHYGKVDPATNSLKFPLSRPCNTGDQCYLSYGNFSTSHLVTFYGFIPQGDNYNDVIPLDIDAAQSDSEGSPTSSWTTHMVRGTWLSNNHEIFQYGLPPPLLDYLRRARSPVLYSDPFSRANLEIEMEVIDDLLSTFGDMMENLGESNPEERESSSWDVKLAVEFKDIQRRIVSSVLSSCYTGRGMVDDELHKHKDRGD